MRGGRRDIGVHLPTLSLCPLLPPPPHRRAEELLKRLCAVDSPRPAVDLEDPAIVARLMRLFHGNAEGAAMEEGVPELDRQQAASMPGEGEE